jgi:hypothetical protein
VDTVKELAPRASLRADIRNHLSSRVEETDEKADPTVEMEPGDHAVLLAVAALAMPPTARLFYGVYLGSSGIIEAALAQGADVNTTVLTSLLSVHADDSDADAALATPAAAPPAPVAAP